MTNDQTGLTTGATYRSAEAWQWAHEPPEAEREAAVSATAVVAVLVTHNAEEWLPQTLGALAALEPKPGRLLAIDTGSVDETPGLLKQALADNRIDALLEGNAEQGFGAAVEQALAGVTGAEWIWLLHDDAAPKRGALGELLRIATAESADVVYPKLLMPKRRNYPDQLLEVGRSMADSGRLIVNVEAGDIDQRHLDSVKTLGGSSAGMLVRSEVWAALGGFAPELPLYRDGLEFGWRANQRGYKVVTCPQAALYHRQAGRLGWRSSAIAPDSIVNDRVAALRLLSATGIKSSRVGVGWLQLSRAAGFLLGKAPSFAGGELQAWRITRSSPDVTQRLAERQPPKPKPVARLRPRKFGGVRHAFDVLGSGLVERYRDLTSDDHGTSIDELTGGDYAGGRIIRRFRVSPFWVATLLIALGALIGARGLLAAGSLSGGGLLAAPSSLTEAWEAFYIPTAGVPGTSPFWLGLLALASTLALGSPALAIKILLLGAPVFAFWAANSALRPWTESALRRSVIAGTWAVTIMVLGFVGAGSLTGVVAGIALPLLVAAVGRWYVTEPVGAERWRAPAAAAWWLLVLAAFYPLAWLVAAVAGTFWAVRSRERIGEVALALVGSLVFLLGWLPVLWHHPGRLLTSVDPLAGADYSPNLTLLVGVINGAAPPIGVSVLFFVLLWAAAATCALRLTNIERLAGLIVVSFAYSAAALLTRFVVPVNGGAARPDASVWLLVAVAAMLAVVVAGVERGGDEERPAWLRPLALLSLPAVATLATLGIVATIGVGGNVGATTQLLPSHVIAAQESQRQTRTLMILLDGASAEWAIVAATSPQWGTAERAPAAAGGELADEYAVLAAALARGQVPDDVATRLANLGVGHIWIRGASATQVANISNAAGLTRAAADDQTQIWTLTGEPSRARLVTSDESLPVTTSELAAGPAGRVLVLAEPQDSRWQASLGDQRLDAVAGLLPSFTVPAQGGQLTWRMAPATAYLWVQILLAAVLIVLSAPVIGAAPRARRSMDG